MKKFLVAVLVIAMVSVMGLVAFAAETLVTGFDAADLDAFMGYNAGLTSTFGVPAPVLSAAKGDDGNGVLISGDNWGGSGQTVQDFYVKSVADALKGSLKADTYLRLYVRNTSSKSNFAFRIRLIGATNADFDATKAFLKDLKGKSVATETANRGGAGENSEIVIPAGFEGYVFFDYNHLLGEGFDLTTLTQIELDMRGALKDGENSLAYVLDSMVVTDSDAVPENEGPVATADVSTIAFAVVSVLGCGALAVRKKR